ncbi:LCP family protein [Planomonospora venezuelensis]|uniref:LCP family protein required for cell wall assembly n=1 Tax=Planomonospora venezuelensis TaxID=1999 RepID=A0A841DGS5_PLAVE|nr:LCP family protein required for cell wall assembly [Planomonospora venezuelensis]
MRTDRTPAPPAEHGADVRSAPPAAAMAGTGQAAVAGAGQPAGPSAGRTEHGADPGGGTATRVKPAPERVPQPEGGDPAREIGAHGAGPNPAAAPAGDGPAPRPRFARPLTAGALIGWTALSAILPGMAHLRAGRRRTGYILLGAFGLLLVLGVIAGIVFSGEGNTGAATRDGLLGLGAGLAGLGALGWFLLVVSSYITLGPNRLDSTGQIVSGVVIGTLCVVVMAPFALAASAVLTIKETANAIFPSEPQDPAAPTFKPEDPWNGQDRVNFLLIGGDGAGNREGVRTDSMNVASIHVKTGNTVMFSLPRNLQHVRFPPTSPLAKQFPDGFMRELPNGGLLNEVWQYAEDHPEVMGRKHQGPRALMDAIGYTLNLKIDYYALINMYGFAHLVDAIGGLKIRIDRDVKYGGSFGTAGTIKAGYRTLSGEEALWYGRSRVGSDDFSRMARQRCVIGAFAKQATPTTVLTNFTKIAGVAKKAAQTNIPRDMLEHLTNLALKVKDAKITSLQFVPPEFYTGSPDWQKIRAATARALRQSLQPSRRSLAGRATASPGTTGASPGTSGAAPTPSLTAPTPSRTPTANNRSAQSLDELCGI